VYGAPVQSSSPTCWPTRWRMPSGRPQRKAAERADENRGRPGAGHPGGRPRRQAQQSNTVSSLRAGPPAVGWHGGEALPSRLRDYAAGGPRPPDHQPRGTGRCRNGHAVDRRSFDGSVGAPEPRLDELPCFQGISAPAAVTNADLVKVWLCDMRAPAPADPRNTIPAASPGPISHRLRPWSSTPQWICARRLCAPDL
jgi:hypothetical protein